MQQHLYQTVELLKNRISKNLEKVRINETMIKEAIANNQFKDLDIYIKELHAENRKILEENAEAIKIQLDIIQFINKYKNNWSVESIVTEINSLKDLSEEEVKKLYKSIIKILKEAIRYKGSSVDAYVDIEGEKGQFVPRLKVYRRTGQKCFRCGGTIKRITLGGRSTHFCPKCQK